MPVAAPVHFMIKYDQYLLHHHILKVQNIASAAKIESISRLYTWSVCLAAASINGSFEGFVLLNGSINVLVGSTHRAYQSIVYLYNQKHQLAYADQIDFNYFVHIPGNLGFIRQDIPLQLLNYNLLWWLLCQALVGIFIVNIVSHSYKFFPMVQTAQQHNGDFEQIILGQQIYLRRSCLQTFVGQLLARLYVMSRYAIHASILSYRENKLIHTNRNWAHHDGIQYLVVFLAFG